MGGRARPRAGLEAAVSSSAIVTTVPTQVGRLRGTGGPTTRRIWGRQVAHHDSTAEAPRREERTMREYPQVIARDAALVQHYLEQIRDGATALLEQPCPSYRRFRARALMLSV